MNTYFPLIIENYIPSNIINIDCSRNALESKVLNKSNNTIIGYFNDNFNNKWGDVKGISIHVHSDINGSISIELQNSKLNNDEQWILIINWQVEVMEHT